VLLFAGGGNNGALFYNPTSAAINGVPPGRFAAAANMNVARARHTLTRFSDGYVLAVGGYDHTSTALSSAELYNPHTNSWTLLASAMASTRFAHTATLLPGDKVFIAGGKAINWFTSSLATTNVFQYNSVSHTGSFVAGPLMNGARSEHVAAALLDGRVLLTGGWDAPDNFAAELYHPASNSISVVGAMQQNRAMHSATVLECPDGGSCYYDGWVVIAGGRRYVGGNPSAAMTVEVFDPRSNSFSSYGQLPSGRTGHQAVQLANGHVLLAGGEDPASFNALSTVHVFDPDYGWWNAGADMTAPRSGLAAIRLTDDSILLANGWGPSTAVWSSAERFVPSRDILPAAALGGNYAAALGGGVAFVLKSGTLPPGLSLNADTGEITGTPTDYDEYRFVVEITEANGGVRLRTATIVVWPTF
jgi:hypothetical protein